VLATAFAHVHLSVLLPGFTPGLPDVLGVPVQPLNLSPPGVSFVVAVFDAFVFDVAFAFDCAFACAVAEALALGPADELD
jgi:hypothetical protein